MLNLVVVVVSWEGARGNPSLWTVWRKGISARQRNVVPQCGANGWNSHRTRQRGSRCRLISSSPRALSTHTGEPLRTTCRCASARASIRSRQVVPTSLVTSAISLPGRTPAAATWSPSTPVSASQMPRSSSGWLPSGNSMTTSSKRGSATPTQSVVGDTRLAKRSPAIATEGSFLAFAGSRGYRPTKSGGGRALRPRRGRYRADKAFAGHRDRGLIPRFRRLPWIPTDEEWRALLHAAREEPMRNRLMLALAYDAGLRREELCLLRTDDIDPAHRTLRIRAETTKSRRERVVPFSASTGILLRAYLAHRRTLSRGRGPLFLSESLRNKAQPITPWTWSKVVRSLALRADLPRFSTHTLRHLCLTDLARSGWELHTIARFAGHANTATTLQYIQLSGRDLAAKLASGMSTIHAWRSESISKAST